MIPQASAPRLVVITDPRYDDARTVEVIQSVCAAVEGVSVQLRDRVRDDEALAPLASRLRAITRAHGATLLLNRRPALARRVGADGLHAEAAGLAGFAVASAPAHSLDELIAARDAGASFALVSPIFTSPGKGPARGVEALTEARAQAGAMAIVALGGVECATARTCFEAGAHGVACIRAVFEAHDPAAAARALVGPW